MRIVCRLEAQKRLTVVPGTPAGSPARSATLRARFMPCFASGKPQPTITSTISPRGSSRPPSGGGRAGEAGRVAGADADKGPLGGAADGGARGEADTASGMRRILHKREGPALAGPSRAVDRSAPQA